MHAFSTPPTQYQIESWLLPHPDVRRLQDARGLAPQRHSLHFVSPLMKATREREERARLKKGHRRWHSGGHQILQAGLHGNGDVESRAVKLRTGESTAVREWSKPRGHHSNLIAEHGEDETAPRKCQLQGHYPVVVVDDGGVDQDRTQSDSKQSMPGPGHHFSAFGVRPGIGDQSRGDSRKNHRRRHSQGHLYSMLAAEACGEREVKGLSRGSGSMKSRHGRSHSQLCESLYTMPLQTAGDRKGSDSGSGSGIANSARSSEKLSATSPPSHHRHKQPSAPNPRAQASRTTCGTHAHQQLQRTSSHTRRQTATALRLHSTDLEALFRSLSCRSLTTEHHPARLNRAGELLQGLEARSRIPSPQPPEHIHTSSADPSTVIQDMSGDHQGGFEGQHLRDIPWQQEAARSNAEEEPGPAFLGSLDYHNFLHGSSKAREASPSSACPRAGTAATPKSRSPHKTEAFLGNLSGPRTAFKANSSNESPVSKLAHKPFLGPLRVPLQQTSDCHSATPSLTDLPRRNPTATLRERRCEALAAQAGNPEALRKIPQRELSVMTDIPVSLTSSTISPSPSSLSTKPLLHEGAMRGIPSGPLSTTSSKGIDPDKLQPFIGPLLPQQPPPTRPLPQLPLPSPVKRRVPTKKLFPNMAGQVDGTKREFVERATKTSMEEAAELRLDEKKGRGLRKKISRFFSSDQPARSADVPACATYQPLSLTTSQDSQRASFSDIFDDVYNAARGSLKSVRGSQNSGRSSYQKPDRASVSARSGISLPPLSSQHYDAHGSREASTTRPSTPLKIEPPPLIDHPAVRADRALQDRLGLSKDQSVAVSSSGYPILPLDIPPLSVNRGRPAQTDTITPLGLPRSALSAQGALSTARLVKEESQATITADKPHDIDPSPAFDRTVDLTWYRTAREEGGTIICSIPRPSDRFEHALTLFVAQYAKGRSFKKYDGRKRFPYFDLPNKIRFEIMRHATADTHTGKPILLNSKRQASPAWPDDAFVSLGSVLRPLQAIMWACPRLRADAMVVLLLTRRFHVIFSPFVKERSQPLPTTWLFRYLHLMQDVSLELDMTKLGFGYSWESTAVDDKIHDIGALVRKFTAEMLTRNPANSMGCLTIHCRRYFGYRQGPNTVQGREDAYKDPLVDGEEDGARPLVPGRGGSARGVGQPRNHNRQAPSLPPSAVQPYSGHFRHHTDLPDRVPFVTEDQLSVASPLRTLVGRVDSVRMVGFSEQWTYATHLDLWPEAERSSVPDTVKHHHIDRQTPSRHLYAAPNHAVYLDYGIDHGVHRFPPLPDSEPMVCK
ncbi:hypothetical protein diail_8303 [Diaporthe ilicicola]|nr:hypothetical protein diail_8303 [Diaporthe ilicicola]